MDNVEKFYQKILEVPVLDPHTHLNASYPAARDLGDVLLYHMVVTDLYSAGCPDAERLDYLDYDERMRRVERAIPFIPYIRNTNCYWGVRIILKDIYGWDDEITLANWKKLNETIKEKSSNAWAREVAKKANIRRFVTEWWRRDPQAADLFDYSLEWAFFPRSQWNQYDASLVEAEYAWSQEIPGAPLPVTFNRSTATFLNTIKTPDDALKAVSHFIDKVPYDEVLNIASSLSTDINFHEVTAEQMADALKRRETAGPAERDVYANFIMNAYHNEIEKKHPGIMLMYSLGAEPLPFESGSKMRSDTVFELAHIFDRYKNINFNIFLASEHQHQAFCSLAREIPNVSLSGYWWHCVYPGIIRRVMETRLDMLPVNKQVGFFSDAYCMDWAYAKSIIVRKQMAQVLQQKVDMGQYSEKTALEVAHNLLYDTSANLMKVGSKS